QTEAGHGANIIMGVGEDGNLGEAIGVTVIATGFNIDQQDDIVNTESKKIIHTLEDEQRAEQQLMGKNVVYKLEEEEEVVEKKPIEKVQLASPEAPTMDLIPTTSYIKNFNVFYEEVIAEDISEEFIVIEFKNGIRDIVVIDPKEVCNKKIEEDQFALSCDKPLTNKQTEEEEKEHVITFSLDEEIEDMDVKDHIEVIPVLEYNKKGETRYSLDDYMELENKLTGAKSRAEGNNPRMVEGELLFERKTIEK